MPISLPKRIICLTDETTETLYLLGEQDRIVGISGFCVRPPQARKEKPKVSAFTSAKLDKILALKPDLVLAFSDMQADICAELIRAGINVHAFNQRSVDEILNMISLLSSMVGAQERGQQLVDRLQIKINNARKQGDTFSIKPKVYFEEWNDPLISGIRWVSELIEIAGGIDCFTELAKHPLAKNRILADPTEVIASQPDIIIGSWCGRKFNPEHIRERQGWDSIPAVINNQLYEIKSANILQPGPAAITEGLSQLQNIFQAWQSSNS